MNYIYNSVTACFSLQDHLGENELQGMLDRIEIFGCKPVGKPICNEEIWVEQELEWSLSGIKYAARFRQAYFRNADCSIFTFALDSAIFLPRDKIVYSPIGDPKFLIFKDILSQLIIDLKPTIGVIDYEADLICSELKTEFKGTIASWGNYFPIKWIDSLTNDVKQNLLSAVDETLAIPNIGLLTFIHPLKANQAWGCKHERLEDIIRRYFAF